MNGISLSPLLYNVLNDFVHAGHRTTFEVLSGLLRLEPGETVVEIGCGTGRLGRHFVAEGYDYWGIDVDSKRIEVARQYVPGGHFSVGSGTSLDRMGLPATRRAFIHGVLHHLDDHESRQVIDRVLEMHVDMALAVIEPCRPERWWFNPMGALMARLDEGRFVRTPNDWRHLFGPRLQQWTMRSLLPRWPVRFIDARLGEVSA